MSLKRSAYKNIEQVAWPLEIWRREVGGFSAAFVHKLINEGKLSSAKVGGARMILESPQEFLERHRDQRDEV